LASSSGGSDEGLVVAIGMLIIFLVIAGSHTTGMSPLQFFFVGVSLTFFATIIFGVVILFVISVCRVWIEAHKADGRTLWQIIKAEYNPDKLYQNYRMVYSHMDKSFRTYWDSPRAARIRRFTEAGLARTHHWKEQIKIFWQYYKDAGRGDDY